MADERDRFDFDKAAVAQMENIRRIGLRRLHCRDEIDDFVQETLLRAFSKRCQLREPAKIDRWIAAIARNLAHEWNRKKRSEPTASQREAVDWRTPHDAVEEAETRKALRKAIGRLTAADREILRARYLEEASYAELQERYGLSYSAVGLRLHRAKKRLWKIYMSITAALAFFFGGYRRAAVGGVFMMSKAAKTAIAAIVCGALIGSFYWAHHAAQEKATHERTGQTARGALNLSAAKGKVADAERQEKGQGQKKTAAAQTENGGAQTHASGSEENDGNPKKIRNFKYEGYDGTGDIEAFYFAYWEMRAAVDRVKSGELKLSDVHALIDGYGFNPDWSLFLRIDVKKQMGLPLSKIERSNHSRAEVATKQLLNKRYSEDRPKMKSQLKPIGDVARWAKQHAPDEYEIVWKHFFKTSAPPPGSLKTYLPVDAYVDWTYGSFFESLSLLPDDAKIFTEYFGKREAAVPAPVNIPPKTSRPASPAAVDHDPADSSAPPPPAPPLPPAKPVEFEAAEMERQRHGVQKGLRRLAESHPDWAQLLLIWADERRKRAPSPPAPPRR